MVLEAIWRYAQLSFPERSSLAYVLVGTSLICCNIWPQLLKLRRKIHKKVMKGALLYLMSRQIKI